MKFFNLDCHISVIADLKKTFEYLGHEVTSWSVSGHNWVFDRMPTSVDVVNQNNWQSLNQDMCDEFYQRYKDELSEYDGFICTYPPAFSMIYEKFKKPIILQIPIRYEVPFQSDINKWEYFNEYLRNGIDSGMIIPVANSEYDKRYFEFFVERECKLIPNICDYTNTIWSPIKNTFLYSSRLKINFDTSFITDKDTLHRYKWEDISGYKGIIIIPYNCSTMSIFEYYTSGIPIFCPSEEFMIDLYSKYSNQVLSELTWNKTFGTKEPVSSIECDRSNDPNRYDNIPIMSKWIKYSDFYNKDWMPHIVYFDSFDDLGKKLEETDLMDIHSKMMDFNKTRKKDIYNLWKKTIEEIK
jgi:hypothetical protein